ncbi:amino acid/amide ABC transporter membrane protein 1, HAAT family (TC 3.A.1.4.-) [Paracoccus aminovorans]|uniref:Amino acid/amide ABC transporter membrane protein 1, HAAT family (TC 3.A.1.4.-) n=1 Tax=Paracoccus aminovorans TaxID=34004 RepID=A0A1I3B3E4_9RHOB|nr:branched-chain amino acid ABC transporter permease [Paracoccus aminovorans]CQR87569.1 amino acid ABC-type transport system, permease components [Paracoccus aminovorans]SFH56838.1 amino acid/amide ABC transporter membrane protein 1, HAAT family (TC 3.A.1.4.-) [Paracoccus aminovorans]
MTALILEQVLNGLQLGVLLFLIAAGLTLIFGVMDFINLSHGSLFMLGAYLAVLFQGLTGSFFLTVLLAGLGVCVVGLLCELLLVRRLYDRSHLDHVLVTYGLILVANEAVSIIWGSSPLFSGIPPELSKLVTLPLGISYPVYRLLVIAVGIAVAALLFWLVKETRVGMRVRAGATNRTIVAVMGVNISLLFTLVFAFGAFLAGLAGALAGPILSVQPGMGETVLILSFVVVVIGGLGSIKGALLAAVLVGLIDTMGRAFLRDFLSAFFSPRVASEAGPALASMLVYILMVLILFFRPEGLLPMQKRS